ncbi:MAG: dynamin family protein [Ktedonobacterales bacterium]
MPIDPERLARIDAQQQPQPTGIAATARAIHRNAGLWNTIPLEAIPLAPVPSPYDGGWRILTLLALPQRQGAALETGPTAVTAYRAPELAIEWSWPDVHVSRLLDLASSPDARRLSTITPTFSARPIATSSPLPSIEQTQRENALFQALDPVLKLSPTEAQSQLDALAPLYAMLLPAEAYPYYWLLAPESARWLRPERTSPSPGNDITVFGPPTFPPSSSPAPATPTTPLTRPDEETTQVDIDWTTDHPARDLSGQLPDWLTRAQALAQRAQASAIVAAFQLLDARRQLPGFRLAFVGEFNRGKSTLINRLLGRAVLPIGVTPTTATITSIVAGSEERMDITFPGGRRESRLLDSAVWRDLVAKDAAQSQAHDTFPQVRVTLENAWLRSLGAELLDTPGAGDLNERRAALVFDALSQSDAAIFLISAFAPFSMTEQAFLEREVLGKRVTRVGVVLSHLDTVPLEERAQVLDAARARVAQVAPQLALLPSRAVTSNGDGQAELEQVRAMIASLARSSDRQAWRSQQIAGRIVDYLSEVATVCETSATAARMSAEQREEALRRAQNAQREMRLRWDSVELELDQRRIAVENDLRRRIASARDDLLRTLEHGLRRSPNPKVWWEEDLPFYLYRELGNIGRGCESLVITSLARDTDWLRATMANLAGQRLRDIAPPQSVAPTIAPEKPRPLPLADMQRVRFLSRVGSGAATIATYLLMGPVGIAVSVGSGLVSEQIINNRVEAQRQIVSRQLEARVSRALEAYTQEIFQRLRVFYTQFATDLRNEQTTALNSVGAAIAASVTASPSSPDENIWRTLAAEVVALQREIASALS